MLLAVSMACEGARSFNEGLTSTRAAASSETTVLNNRKAFDDWQIGGCKDVKKIKWIVRADLVSPTHPPRCQSLRCWAEWM